MLSDFIRSLRDPEFLYKNVLVLADQLEDVSKTSARKAIDGVKTLLTWLWKLFLIAWWTTVGAIALWAMLRIPFLHIEALWPYQLCLAIVGLFWALFLFSIMVVPRIVLDALRGIPRVEQFIDRVEESIRESMKLPAWIALVSIFLAILVGRFPNLRNPTSILSVMGIIAVVILASFLGVFRTRLVWLQRFIVFQLFLALVLLLLLPQFPHLSAWLRQATGRVDRELFKNAAPRQLLVDVKSPPPFFDPVTKEPLVYYSHSKDGSYKLWNGPGHDPDTGELLEPVTNAQLRDDILRTLLLHAKLQTRQLPARTPHRLEIRLGESLPPMFDRVTRSNKVWISGDREVGFKLYDGPGFDETTGEPLIPVTTTGMVRELVDWKQQKEEAEKAPPNVAPAVLTPHPAPATNVDGFNRANPKGAQSEDTRNGPLPPLIVSAKLLPDSSGWRLFLMNNSKSNLDLTFFNEVLGGIEYLTAYNRRLAPGEKEFIPYKVHFKPGDKLQIICRGFEKPYTHVFQ